MLMGLGEEQDIKGKGGDVAEVGAVRKRISTSA